MLSRTLLLQVEQYQQFLLLRVANKEQRISRKMVTAALACALRIGLVVDAQKRGRIVPDVSRDGVNPVGLNRMPVSCPQQIAGHGSGERRNAAK